MEKSKILICSHSLNIGGAERSLLDLLKSLDYSEVEVDLFLYRHEGEWMKEIPKEVKLLPEVKQYSCLAVPMKLAFKKAQFGVLMGRVIGREKAKYFNCKNNLTDSIVSLEYSHKYTRYFMPKIQQEIYYDLAISYLTPHYFVSEKVNAKTKIAWIHTDYSVIDVDIYSEKKMWDEYDYIASISESCTNSFLKKFPSLNKKIVLIENVLCEKTVHEKAKTNVSKVFQISKKSICLLSIGRYSYAKNFEQIPEICSLIINGGCNVKWYIIGYGDDSEIRKNITRFKMEDYVILLGKRDNPYPYINICDVYIQPSRYEGKSVTVREAQILHKPVIITNYPTAKKQLEDGYDGIIVPMNNNDCAKEIVNVLNNRKLLEQITSNTRNRDYSNRAELEKLYLLAKNEEIK